MLKTKKKSKLRAEILMASSVVYAGRWRVGNNFSHSSRVSKPSACHPHPGQRDKSERGRPSAIIWNQHRRHCPPFVFQASLWGLSLEVFVLSLLYSDYSWKPKRDFSLYWTTVKVKEFQLKLMEFLLQKGISWHGFAPRSGKYTRLSPGTTIWLPLSPVQSPLTRQQPLNPIQYALLQIVVLMA